MTTGVDRAYRRISLETERSGSIDKQGVRLSAAVTAAGRDPAKIVWYDDRSVSGSKVAFGDREAGARLLADLKPGDRVLVTKIDRAARNVTDLLSIVAAIQAAGASVRFVDNDINTDGPWGRFMLTLLAAIAELEANIIGERMRESRQVFLAEGRHTFGKLPYGFITTPNPKGNGLVLRPDPDMVPMLREAITDVINGASQAEVADRLGLNRPSFGKWLRNPRLAGMTPVGDGVVMLEGVPRIDPEQAILSVAEWVRLSEYLGRRPEQKAWSKAPGLARALKCAACGERVYLSADKKTAEDPFYRCQNVKWHRAQGTSRPAIKSSMADEFMAERFLAKFGKHPHVIVAFAADESKKLEALSLAQLRIQETQKRMGSTSDPQEISALATELIEAHAERAAAEAMTVERVSSETTTGETLADVWERSSDDERERLMLKVGWFTLRPGRGKVHDRIKWHRTSEGPGLTLVEAFNLGVTLEG